MHDQEPGSSLTSRNASRAKPPKVRLYILLASLTLAALAATGILDRKRSDEALAQWTDAQAVSSVDLVTPAAVSEAQHLTLPADFKAFNTARIHPRVNGYVKAWYVDIGAHVKAGDVLARIDTPDLDQQYEQAKGELAKARADYNLALVTQGRWNALRSSQAVSQQAADEKTGDALARKAEVEAAQANVDRLKALEGFKAITAPFDGVVTARHIDIGALVAATSGNEQALFDVSAVDVMRVYVSVPQVYTAMMRAGMKVTLKLPQYAGRTFTGTLTTTSNAISAQSRALLVEALIKNPDGLLSPGAYAQARFDLPFDSNAIEIPASAMIFRDGAPKVAVVRDGRVELTRITILVDTGTQLEVAADLPRDDRIVLNPSDSIATGDVVHVAKLDYRPVDDKVASVPPRDLRKAVE